MTTPLACAEACTHTVTPTSRGLTLTRYYLVAKGKGFDIGVRMSKMQRVLFRRLLFDFNVVAFWCAVGPHARCDDLCDALVPRPLQHLSFDLAINTTNLQKHSHIVFILPRTTTKRARNATASFRIARFTHFDGKNVEDFLASKGELVKRSKGGAETLEFFEPPTATATLEGGKEDSSEQRILSLSEKKSD